MYLHVQFPTNSVKSTINIDGSFTIHSHNTYINTLKKKLYTFCNNEWLGMILKNNEFLD